MKTGSAYNSIRFLFILAILSFTYPSQAQLFKKKAKVETIETKCEGLKLSERPTITVSRFDVTTYRAKQHFGEEVASMLSNALVETGCFNVLAGADGMADIAGETMMQQQYGGDNAEMSKIKKADYFITGQITEFEENHHGTNTLGVKIGAYKAHIGFIIQIKNAQREILFSKSVDKTRIKPGTGGITVFNLPVATASFSSKAMAEALERGIIDAVEILVEQKDQLEMTAPKPVEAPIAYNRSNCQVLASGNAPKIMVILPETHIQRRIPDPAGETEIIKKLANAGFPVVDPTMYMAIRNGGEINEIVKNPAKAAAIGAEHGADIIIIGEAFSEATGNVNGMVNCRARVEARAIDTRTATIIAADGKHGTGLDIAETVSAKVALRNAGAAIGDYFLANFCERGVDGVQTKLINQSPDSGGTKNIVLKDVDFKMVSDITSILKAQSGVSDVAKKMTNGEWKISFSTARGMDELLDAIMSDQLGTQLDVKELVDTKLVLAGL